MYDTNGIVFKYFSNLISIVHKAGMYITAQVWVLQLTYEHNYHEIAIATAFRTWTYEERIMKHPTQ